MNVLSLFDGISCGRIAIERAGIKINTYYASEIDPYAIKITQKNYPNTIQLGDIIQWKDWHLPQIDLLIGGSPCQGFSHAGKKLNFDDPRSKLFFNYVDILRELKPKYFLLENVKMKQEWIDIITFYLGVEPIELNSELVSAQMRKRLYWTNIPNIQQPKDKGILLEDIVESDALVDRDKAHAIIASIGRTTHREYFFKNQGQIVYKATMLSNIYGGFGENKPRVYLNKNVNVRTSTGGGYIPSLIINNVEIKFDLNNIKDIIRKVTPLECERLQTIPDNYTYGISNTQRYKCIGNGWTVDMIAHILSYLLK